jgi:hypothetical protein
MAQHSSDDDNGWRRSVRAMVDHDYTVSPLPSSSSSSANYKSSKMDPDPAPPAKKDPAPSRLNPLGNASYNFEDGVEGGLPPRPPPKMPAGSPRESADWGVEAVKNAEAQLQGRVRASFQPAKIDSGAREGERDVLKDLPQGRARFEPAAGVDRSGDKKPGTAAFPASEPPRRSAFKPAAHLGGPRAAGGDTEGPILPDTSHLTKRGLFEPALSSATPSPTFDYPVTRPAFQPNKGGSSSSASASIVDDMPNPPARSHFTPAVSGGAINIDQEDEIPSYLQNLPAAKSFQPAKGGLGGLGGLSAAQALDFEAATQKVPHRPSFQPSRK